MICLNRCVPCHFINKTRSLLAYFGTKKNIYHAEPHVSYSLFWQILVWLQSKHINFGIARELVWLRSKQHFLPGFWHYQKFGMATRGSKPNRPQDRVGPFAKEI